MWYRLIIFATRKLSSFFHEYKSTFRSNFFSWYLSSLIVVVVVDDDDDDDDDEEEDKDEDEDDDDNDDDDGNDEDKGFNTAQESTSFIVIRITGRKTITLHWCWNLRIAMRWIPEY